MKRRIASIAGSLLALLLGAASPAFALQPDPTGLWYNPAESGWGLTVEQQNATMFVVLFVYDASGRPAWYVAPSIGGAIDFFPPLPAGGPVSGTLYRTSGPFYGGAFDPHAVGATEVGTVSIGYPDDSAQSLSVDYTIDGVHVTKMAQRQTWSDGYVNFSGVYQGAAVVDAQGTAGCPFLNLSPPLGIVTAFNVAPTFAAHEVRIGWSTGVDTGCTIDGTYQQTGQLAAITGTLACGAINAPPPSSMAVSLGAISFDNGSFTTAFRVHQGSCTYTGHLGGVRIR